MSKGKVRRVGNTRLLECAVRLEYLAQVKADITANGWPYRVTERALNGEKLLVEVPVGLANDFATWINTNGGDML